MIKKYKKKDGSTAYLFTTYLGVDPLSGKQRRTTRRGFKSQKEAKQAEAKLLEEVELFGFKNSTKTTFSELVSMWLPTYRKTVKESTYAVQSKNINAHLLSAFGDMRVDKITPMHCQKMANDLADKLVAYRVLMDKLKNILDYAVSLDVIRSNPVEKVIYPKPREIEKDLDNVYSKEELIAFFKAIENEKQHVKLMFHLLAYTGIRKGELLALEWSDVDFENKTLSINKTLARVSKGTAIQKPKTKNGQRIISLDDTTVQLLRQYKTANKILYLNNSIIFSNKGRYLSLYYLSPILNRILKNSHLKKITPHGFRHTHCSLLIEAGVGVKEIQMRLGHKDIETTLNIYTHLTRNQHNQAIGKFVDFMEAAN